MHHWTIRICQCLTVFLFGSRTEWDGPRRRAQFPVTYHPSSSWMLSKVRVVVHKHSNSRSNMCLENQPCLGQSLNLSASVFTSVLWGICSCSQLPQRWLGLNTVLWNLLCFPFTSVFLKSFIGTQSSKWRTNQRPNWILALEWLWYFQNRFLSTLDIPECPVEPVWKYVPITFPKWWGWKDLKAPPEPNVIWSLHKRFKFPQQSHCWNFISDLLWNVLY